MSRNSVRFERRGGAQDEFVKIPLNYKSQLSFNPSSNHCKFSLARSSPILDSNQFLRIRTIAKINERGKQEFVNQSDSHNAVSLLENIHRWGSVVPPRPREKSGEERRGVERRIGSPSNDVSPAVGDRFRRRKPRTSGNLITSRRSTALIRDLSRWTGRRAAKIEPALPPPPPRRERGREGRGTRTGKRVKLETKTLRAGQARDPFATITFYRLSWRVNCV